MNQTALTKLAAGLAGTAIEPTNPAYEEARSVWNGTVDKHPALIVQCSGVGDVVEAVNFAREQGLAISVRGGGHHVAGAALVENGLVIDMSPMRDVSLDPATGRARAAGGSLLKDVDNATLPQGRTVPMGVFADTGIGGLTLSGGYGWQSRLHGLTCDHLVSAEVVTAEGKVLTASAEENPDLFWALRGGGTRLGVVTSFEYQTQPIPPELQMLFVTYPAEEAKQVLTRLRDFMSTAPRQVGVLGVFWTFPESEPFPREVWGRQFIGIAGPYLGPAEEGQRVMQPLRQLGTVLVDMSDVMPFAAVQQLFDEDYPNGRRYYWRSSYLHEFDDAAVDAYIDLGLRRPSPLSSLDLWCLGGAVGDVGMTDTPIAHRQAPNMIGIEANWDDPADDAANIAWARESQKLFEPFSMGSYLNFDDPGEAGRLAAVYGPNLARLHEVKQRYDPQGLFH